MKWKLDDSIPIWPQLKEQLIIEIVAGRFEKGSAFPTVRDLAEDAGVNRNTMQRALSELEHDGFVITNRTAGRVVTSDERLISDFKEKIARQNVEKFIKEMEPLGYDRSEIVQIILDDTEKQQKGGTE